MGVAITSGNNSTIMRNRSVETLLKKAPFCISGYIYRLLLCIPTPSPKIIVVFKTLTFFLLLLTTLIRGWGSYSVLTEVNNKWMKLLRKVCTSLSTTFVPDCRCFMPYKNWVKLQLCWLPWLMHTYTRTVPNCSITFSNSYWQMIYFC